MTLCVCIGLADAAVRSANSTARNTTTATARNSAGSVARRTVQRNITQRATTPQNVSRATVQQRTTSTPSRAAVSQKVTAPRITRAATESVAFGSGYNSCRDAYFTCMDQFCATADDSYRRCICSSRLDEIKSKQRALDDTADQIQNFKDLNIDVIPKTAAEVNAMLTASSGEYAASVAKDTSDSAQKLAGISSVLANSKSKSLSTAGTLDIAGDINAIWARTELANGVNIANLTGETLYNAVHSQCADLVSEHCESKSTLNMVIAAYGMYIENDCTMLSNALDSKKNNANAVIRETEREMTSARLDNYNAHNSTSINDCVAKVRNDITADTACGNDYIHCLDVTGTYLNRDTGEPIYSASFYQLETMISLSGDVLTNQTNRFLVAELNRKRVFAEKSLSTCQDLADDVWDEFLRQAITAIYQGQQSRIRKVKDECLDVVNQCYDVQSASLRDFSNTKEQLLLGSRLELSEQLCIDKLSACSNLYGGGASGMQELVAAMKNITSQKIAQNCLSTLQDYIKTLCTVPSNDTLHSYPYACRAYAPGEQKYATDWACQNNIQQDSETETTNGAKRAVAESAESETRQNVVQNAAVRSAPSAMIGSPARSASETGTKSGSTTSGYVCDESQRTYISCKKDFFLSDCWDSPQVVNPANNTYSATKSVGGVNDNGYWYSETAKVTINKPRLGNNCHECAYLDPDHHGVQLSGIVCPGGKVCPYKKTTGNGGGTTPNDDETPEASKERCSDYVGSLYQKVVRYALQSCMRPSEIETITNNKTPISSTVLQDVNTAMDSVRVSMSNELKLECERLGGYWIATQFDDTSYTQNTDIHAGKLDPFTRFYNETSANKKWGYCADPDMAKEYFGLEQKQQSSSD